jgi:hypothetical protein
VNLSSWLGLRVSMITDDIHELGRGITCGRHGLETKERICDNWAWLSLNRRSRQ